MSKELSKEKMMWATEQVVLWSDNDFASYERKMNIFRNLAKKKDNGTYDPMKAEKAINYLPTSIRRELNRTMKDNFVEMIGTTMPPLVSTWADEEIRIEFENWYKSR